MTNQEMTITKEYLEIKNMIKENMHDVLCFKKIKGIELYKNIFMLSSSIELAEMLFNDLIKYLTNVCQNFYKKITNKKSKMNNKYIDHFLKYSNLLSVISDLFVPIDEVLMCNSIGKVKSETFYKLAVDIFDVEILKMINIGNICMNLLKEDLNIIFNDMEYTDYKRDEGKYPKFIDDIAGINVDKIQKVFWTGNESNLKNKNIKRDESKIDKGNFILLQILQSLKIVSKYNCYYEKDAIISIIKNIKNKLNSEKNIFILSKNASIIFNKLEKNIERIFLECSYEKIYNLIDQEIIHSRKEKIIILFVHELVELFYNYKIHNVLDIHIKGILNFRSFPSFNAIFEESLLKFILHFRHKEITEIFKFFNDVMEIIKYYDVKELELVVINAFKHSINNKEYIEEKLVTFIHNNLLKLRNKEADFDKCMQPFDVFFPMLKYKQLFYDYYLIYLEKRLLSGEVFYENDMIQKIKEHEINYVFLRNAQSMISEISKSFDSLYIDNNFFYQQESQIQIQPLVLSRNYWSIKDYDRIKLPEYFNRIIKFICKDNSEYYIANSHCIVEINDKLYQMTLLHYLVLIEYSLEIEDKLLNEIRLSLNNLENSNYLLELKNEDKKYYQENDHFLVAKARLLKYLKRNQKASFNEIMEILKINSTNLEDIITECINQMYIRKENDTYFYLP